MLPLKVDPAWVEAIATVVAAAGTIIGVPGTVVLLWLGLRDRRRDNRERRRAQAARVQLTKVTTNAWSTLHRCEITAKCTVKNTSDDVITDVRVLVALKPVDDPTNVRRIEREIDRIDPGGYPEIECRFELPEEPHGVESTASMSFTDGAGNRWRRDARHRLKDLGPG